MFYNNGLQNFFLFIFLVSLLGCNINTRKDKKSVRPVTDLLGREVLVPEKINSVAGLRAGALRLLVYMDATEMIAGIEEAEIRSTTPYISAHPELLELPFLGPSMGGDAELILKASPDVIFVSYTTAGDADALEKKTGIPVLAIECPEFATGKDKLFASFRLIGNVLDKTNRADSLINYINASIDELGSRTNDIQDSEKPSVYIGGVSYSGAYGISSTQPYYPPFIFLNAKNVTADINERLVSHVKGTFIDKEQLLLWNPDVIFIDISGIHLAKKDIAEGTALFNSLKAIKNNNIYTLLPYNNYAINYELVLANAWYCGKILYPEKFSDIDTKNKTIEILEVFLGKNIYDKIIENTKSFRAVKKKEL